MLNTIKASLYKLIKDRFFKITLIIGAVLAVALTLIYCVAIPDMGMTGYTMMLTASSPTNNFGIAVPINLVVFIVGEFNYGTIRNKIIAGNKRINIYLSLFIIGIIFSLTLMIAYIGISTGLTTLITGKFVPEDGGVSAAEIWSTIGYTLVIYITLSALSVFTSAAFRNIGASITVTVILIMVGLIASVISLLVALNDPSGIIPDYFFLVNPLFISSVMTSFMGLLGGGISNLGKAMLLSIASNAIYTAIFFSVGFAIFNYRDVK